MKNKLAENIKALQNLEDIKLRLEELETELTYENDLLSTLLPWLEKKQQMLDEAGAPSSFVKLFIKKEESLAKTREEHHQMTLRANKLKKKIELLQYEKNILKEKMMKKAQFNYQIEQIIEGKPIGKELDNYQHLLDLKFVNKSIKKNIQSQKELNNLIEIGKELDALLLRACENIRQAAMSPELSFIQGDALRVLMKRKSLLETVNNLLINFAEKLKHFDAKAKILLLDELDLLPIDFTDVTKKVLLDILGKHKENGTLAKALQDYTHLRVRVTNAINSLKAKTKVIDSSSNYLKKEKAKLIETIAKKN